MNSLAKSLFSLTILIAASTFSAGPVFSQRTESNLDLGWRFHKGEFADGQNAGIDESNWEPVTVPHTWNAEDAANGGGDQHDSSKGYYRGSAWYRRAIELPETDNGKRVFVRFESASMVAAVYVNGQLVGSHRGGFTAFCFEITSQIKFGQTNLLAVKVDNTYQTDVAPLSGDFPVFGGLIRPVQLIVSDMACITPLDFGSTGVYFQQANVSAKSAEIKITTKIDNGYDQDKTLTVRTELETPGGKTVWSDDNDGLALSNKIESVVQTATLNDPHLWNGIDDPFLYKLISTVSFDGKPIDSITQLVGIRDFRIDADKGAFLNGRHYPVHGMCRHEDRAGRGRALTFADHDQDMKIIREIGARGLRLAHYPHSKYFLDLCDREGLLIWSEIPIVDRITNNEAFTNNARQQLTEMIRQNRNRPSIICWGLWNELMHEPSPNPVALIQGLHELAGKEDPTRPTVGAANWASQQAPGLREVATLTAWNKYLGWYGGEADEMLEFMQKMNELAGEKGIAISEYGAGGSLKHHEQGMTERPDTRGKWHPEEWQNHVHEVNFAAIKASPFVWGSFGWNMFDFASVWRDEGDTIGINDKGLVTYDRTTKKDTFYFYKANLSDQPVAYITSRRHFNRTEELTEVKAYSNCDDVTLSVNGETIGKQDGDNHVFRWPDVKLRSGKNTIRLTGVHNGKTITDQCHWNLSAEHSDSTLTSAGGGIEHSPFVPAGFKLDWSDEFNGAELDQTKWSFRYEGRMRGQGLLSAESVTLKNGILSLTTKKIDGQLHTGMITTKGKYGTTFGYFESRIRFQKLQGHHGSFWLQSDEQSKFPGDPAKGGAEIDVVEFFGSGRGDRGVGVNLYWINKEKKKAHVGTSKLNLDPILGPKSKEGSSKSEKRNEICDEFHVFAVQWTSEGYKYFIDGNLLLQSNKGVSKRDEYLILSLLCHDWEAPRLKHDQLPDAMQVDYVRVYKLNEATDRKK